MDSPIKKIAGDLVEQINKIRYIGMGSGRTMSDFVDALASFKIKNEQKFVPTSYQIALKLKEKNFEVEMFPHIKKIELYIDGVDQIEEKSHFAIKGGGGALQKEKILMNNSEKTVFILQEKKVAERLGTGCPVPVEVSPFASSFVTNYMKELGASSELRKDQRGFPMFTEGGNMIIDVSFNGISDAIDLEHRIKAQPGVIEVGLFTKKPSCIYILKESSFEKRS
ncbi:MAG: ribose 5-phosphate isomerase A [Nitrososphaeria archaeon]